MKEAGQVIVNEWMHMYIDRNMNKWLTWASNQRSCQTLQGGLEDVAEMYPLMAYLKLFKEMFINAFNQLRLPLRSTQDRISVECYFLKNWKILMGKNFDVTA